MSAPSAHIRATPTRRRSLLVSIVLLLLCAVGLTSVADAGAAINKQVNFQGRLTDPAGLAVPDGTYNLEFKLHNHTTNTGGAQGVCSGSCLWMESRTGVNRVTVIRGLFSVQLGSVATLSAFSFDQDPLYLSIRVGGTALTPVWDTEMTPRQRLAAAPFAIHADDAATATTSLDITCAACITSTDLAAGSVGTSQILDGSVALADLAANSVDSSKVVDGSIALGDLAANSVDGSKVVDGSVALADLAANSVNSSKVVDGSIAGADILDNTITSADIAAGGIGSTEIFDGSLTAADLAANSVDGSKIVDGSVALADLAANSVNSSKIVDGSVTSADILDNSITYLDIAAGGIGSTEIFDGSLTAIDLAANSVNSSKIVDGSVTGTDILDGTITAGDIATNAVTSNEIATATINYTKFAEQPNSRVHLSVNRSVSNASWQNITFDSANDTFGMWNGSGRITIPAGMGGLYLITADVQFAGSSGGNRLLHIKMNGTSNVCETGDHGATSGAVFLNCSDMTALSPGDYLQMEAYQNSGGAINVTDGHMRAYRLPS